ncbi:hypothetical protein Tco_0060668 [Tanacetum coccineum]
MSKEHHHHTAKNTSRTTKEDAPSMFKQFKTVNILHQLKESLIVDLGDDDSFYLLCIILEAPTLVRQSRQVCECSRFGCPAGPTGTMYMKLAGYVKLLKAMAVTMKAVALNKQVLGVKTMNLDGVRKEQKLRLCGVQRNQEKKPKRVWGPVLGDKKAITGMKVDGVARN